MIDPKRKGTLTHKREVPTLPRKCVYFFSMFIRITGPNSYPTPYTCLGIVN